MKKIYFVSFIVFLLFTRTAISADVGTISGVVFDAESKFLLSKVQVSIEALGISTMTDIDGKFKLADIPAGEYEIHTSSLYFKGKAKKVDVKKGRNSGIDFDLNINYNLLVYKKYILMGIVTDFDTGEPIPDARVILSFEAQGTKTNSKGQFILFLPHEKSIVSIFIIKDKGYNEKVDRIVLDPGPVTRIDVRIKKEVPFIRKTFNSKYRDFTNEFLSFLKGEIENMGSIRIKGPNTLSVRETEENILKIKKMIEKYDVPFKQIWLELRLIYASNETNGGSKMPDELKTVSEQLKSLFRFNKYELLDDAKVSVEENSHCMFRTGKGYCDVKIQNVEFINENGGLIKLKNINLQGRVNNGPILATTVNIPNGDTLIIGTSSADESGKALIAVVTAKVK